MKNRDGKDLFVPDLSCRCRRPPEQKRVTVPPFLLFSTFAQQLQTLTAGHIPVTAEVGTWRCGKCGHIHTVTAGSMRFAST